MSAEPIDVAERTRQLLARGGPDEAARAWIEASRGAEVGSFGVRADDALGIYRRRHAAAVRQGEPTLGFDRLSEALASRGDERILVVNFEDDRHVYAAVTDQDLGTLLGCVVIGKPAPSPDAPPGEGFVDQAIRVLGPLAADFALAVAAREEDGMIHFVVLRNATTGIRVSLDVTAGSIKLQLLRIRGDEIPAYVGEDGFPIREVLEARGVEARFDDSGIFSRGGQERTLSQYARAVREHAADVLRGDFTILDEVLRQRHLRFAR